MNTQSSSVQRKSQQNPAMPAVCSAEEQKAKKSGSRGGPTEARKPRIRFLRRIGKTTVGRGGLIRVYIPPIVFCAGASAYRH